MLLFEGMVRGEESVMVLESPAEPSMAPSRGWGRRPTWEGLVVGPPLSGWGYEGPPWWEDRPNTKAASEADSSSLLLLALLVGR